MNVKCQFSTPVTPGQFNRCIPGAMQAMEIVSVLEGGNFFEADKELLISRLKQYRKIIAWLQLTWLIFFPTALPTLFFSL